MASSKQKKTSGRGKSASGSSKTKRATTKKSAGPRKVAAKAKKKTAKTAKKGLAKPKKRTKKVTGKAAARPKKAAPKKGVKKARKTTAKKKESAKVGVRRKRAAKAPAPGAVEEKREVVLAYPQSTISGTEPHAAAEATSAVIAIRSSKYELTPPERVVEPVYPAEAQTDLPERYDDTRLVILVRDPEWLFLYWEISRADREILGLVPEEASEPLVVRLHDVTEVEEFNGVNSLSWYEIPISAQALSWYVHLPKVDREWVAELGILNEQGEFIQICRSNRARTPRNFLSDVEDTEWMTISREFQEILARSADVAFVGASGLSTEAAIKRISRRLRAALEHHEGSPGGSGLFRARRGGAAAEQEAPELPLSVRTELIVSGSTDPGANLTVQGSSIDLRPDGSFTVRFELPDGEQVVNVRATSSDGSITREIVPVVQKETRT